MLATVLVGSVVLRKKACTVGDEPCSFKNFATLAGIALGGVFFGVVGLARADSFFLLTISTTTIGSVLIRPGASDVLVLMTVSSFIREGTEFFAFETRIIAHCR